MPIYLGEMRIKGSNNLVRVYVGSNKAYDAYSTVRRTVNEVIPVTNKSANDPNMWKYTTRYVAGSPGNNQVVYEDRYKYGVLYETVKISSVQTKAMVQGVTYSGTKTGPIGSAVFGSRVDPNTDETTYWWDVSGAWPSQWIGRQGYIVAGSNPKRYFKFTAAAQRVYGSGGYYPTNGTCYVV